MPGWWLLRWDRAVMFLTQEDELCEEQERVVGGTLGACQRRWDHPGRCVWRPYR